MPCARLKCSKIHCSHIIRGTSSTVTKNARETSEKVVIIEIKHIVVTIVFPCIQGQGKRSCTRIYSVRNLKVYRCKYRCISWDVNTHIGYCSCSIISQVNNPCRVRRSTCCTISVIRTFYCNNFNLVVYQLGK